MLTQGRQEWQGSVSISLGHPAPSPSSMQSGSVSGRHTQSEGATARPLLTPDEVLRWPSGHSLLIQSGEYPADMPLQDLGGWRSAAAAFQPADPPKSREAGAVPTWLPGTEASEETEEDASVELAARDGGAQSAAAVTVPTEVAGSVEQGPEPLAPNTSAPERPTSASRPKGSGRFSGGRGRA